MLHSKVRSDKCFDLFVDASCIKSVFLKKSNSRTGLAVNIIDTDTLHRYRSFLSKALAYSAAKTADDGMLLNSYNFTSFFCCSYNKLLIKRLDGVDVDNLCFDSLFCKLSCCFKRRSYAKSVGNMMPRSLR